MKSKFFWVVIIFFIGIVIAGFISYGAVKETYRTSKLEKEVSDLQEEARKVQKDNDSLAKKIAYLETVESQQRMAKDKLNMKLPDENVVIIKQSKNEEEIKSEEDILEENSLEDEKNYKKWLNLFLLRE